MYQILRRSPERPAQYGREAKTASSALILQMQENPSHRSDEASGAMAALALCLIALLFVPGFALSALALLIFTLERLARSQPASETPEMLGDLVRHCDSTGQVTEFPAKRTRLLALGHAEAGSRVFLETHGMKIEVARCLGQHERREVAKLVNDAQTAAAPSGGLAWS